MNLAHLLAKEIANLYQYGMDRYERSKVNNICQYEDFQLCNNIAPKHIKKIAFIIPALIPYSGGQTSILRLGTLLSKDGYDISYICYEQQSPKSMQEVARQNLYNVAGKYYEFKNAFNEQFDLIISTSWESVYYARRIPGYKMYFVQDYEPYFFKLNERYLLAKKTYELGLHIVSLGRWNIQQIQKECNTSSILDMIDFPYECSEYKSIKKDYDCLREKKLIKIAVYSKEEGKRIPNLIQNILYNASKKFEEQGIKLDITFFGFSRDYKVMIGRNIGKLNKAQLNELYKQSDFGLVASMSNISLVPYEMMATGLPVIEFAEGSFLSFFPDSAAILIDYDFMTIFNKLMECINDPAKLEQMNNNCQNIIKDLSWDKSVKQFEDILKSIESNE